MEELQEEYSDDIHFLLAKLQHLTQKEDVSMYSILYGIFFLEELVRSYFYL